jgi:hypothetical protein
MKRRILIFSLLGPALSCLVLAALDRSFLNLWVIAAPITVVVVLAPLLLCALIDLSLEEARLSERLVTMAISGFMLTFIATWMIGATSQNIRALQVGLVGAIPAVICSWLSGLRSWRLYS